MNAEEIATIRATLPPELPGKKARLKSAELMLPPDQIERLDTIARRENKSRNALMSEAVVKTYLRPPHKKR